MNEINILSQDIKDYAKELGFDACGFCKAEPIEQEASERLQEWIGSSYYGEMGYMANNIEKRVDPCLLVEGAKSVISLAMNYYPETKQRADVPQFAYYAYGKDYHDVMKGRLQLFLDFIRTRVEGVNGRVFCDTAPVMERYWAMKAGLGFIGKNSLLIIPRKGSYFFLGELILDIELAYDEPCRLSCGNCSRCLDACPTKAIIAPKVIDARKCISYQTIEQKGEIDESIAVRIDSYFYGCDICQQVCPWNRYARPHQTADFNPSQAFLNLDEDNLANLSIEEYQRIFKGSAVKRAKLSGLKRNIEVWKNNKNNIQ